MRNTHLVITCDFGLARFDPFRSTSEMLRFKPGIAEDLWVQGHPYKLIGGHSFPKLVEKAAVVDLQSWILEFPCASAGERSN